MREEVDKLARPINILLVKETLSDNFADARAP